MTAKIDKFALAKRFLQLGEQEQAKFIALLDAKGMNFEKLPIVAADAQRAAPLSPAQRRLWNIYQLDAGNSAYHISGGFELKGELDIACLEQALHQVMDKQHALRTRFIEDEAGEMVQHIERQPIAHVQQVNGQHLTTQELAQLAAEFIRQPFDLAHELPVRMQCIQVGAQSAHLHIVMHHLVSDGWSIGVFMRDLVAAYQGATLTAPDVQYRDFSLWQSALLRAGKGEQDLDYWRRETGATQPEKLFAWQGQVVPNQRREAAQIHHQLDIAERDAVSQMARQLNVTPSSLWLALWQTALHKQTGRSDVSVGMPMANRERGEVSELIGFFVNTMVIAQQMEPSQTLKHVAMSTHAKVLEAQQHQLLPFDQVVEHLVQERIAGETPLFQVLFNHQVSAVGSVQFAPGLHATPLSGQGQFALFDVALDVLETEHGVSLTLTYAKDRIRDGQMKALAAGLITLTNNLAQNLNQTLARLNVLSQPQREQLQQLAQPEGQWRYQSVPTLIDQHATLRPHAIALKHGEQAVTFAELKQRSDMLAAELMRHGVVRDQAVGVLYERGGDMIVAMIAVMKAGGAFLPLDPDYPTQRLAYMLDDAGAHCLLSQSHLNSRWEDISAQLQQHQVEPLWTDKLDDAASVSVLPEILSDQLAYIIYTSGSTGKPKGVAIAHDGISMHVQTIGHQYGMTPQDVELHFASISFDGAVERWTVPLAFGSRLVIRDQTLWSAEQTCQVLQDESVTIACFPPSYVGPLLDWIEQTQPELQVRSWTLGGEAFTRETYDRLQRVVKPPRIINGYGPTETVVTPMIWRAYPHDTLQSAYAPIGQPVGQRRLYVLDNQLSLVAPGEVGELYIGDEVGLARGYLARPDLTAERFVPDPFHREGQRMYRTGDLVRWRDDGVMEYLGRVDQQVKIRGFRIELGEIESLLQQVSGVKTCVVAAYQRGSLSQLVGYLYGHGAKECDQKLVLSQLAETLPDYMVPSQLVVLDSLPLTPAGKIDRNALPLPELENHSSHTAPPQGDKEQLIATLWQDLLGLNDVSRDDSFFALGGDSILCLQLVSKLKLAGYSITPKQIFAAPVLKQLAASLQAAREEQERALPTEPFGLMPIQAHFLAQNFAEPNHWNQHVCLELKQEMDLAALQGALGALVSHHPSLRLAFSQTSEGWQQSYQTAVSHEVLWQSDLEDVQEFAAFAHELQTSLDIRAGRLIQAGYARINGQLSRLMIVIHHLAVDGVSWRVLMDDLWRAYQQQLAGQTVSLPANYASLDRAVTQLAKWRESETFSQQSAYWDAHLSTSSDDAPVPAFYRDRTVVNVAMDAKPTSALLQSERLNARLIEALSRVLLQDDGTSLTINLEGHGREESVFGELDLSRMVGWMTSLYPLRVSKNDDAAAITEHLEKVRVDGGISFGSRYLDDSHQEVPADVTFNYLGQYSANQFSHWCQPVVSGSADQSGDNTMLTPLMINVQVVGGKLSAGWEFATSHYTQQQIQTFAHQWLEVLKELTVQEENTPARADRQLAETLNSYQPEARPVFCVHPVTGRVVGYQKLAQALNGQRTVYGIQSQSFVYPDKFDVSFREMADTYCATIREIQPQGPYTLVGWSLGGALCQEITARLERLGEAVDFVGLLDCYVPGTEIAEDQWQSPQAKAKLIHHLEMLLGELSAEQKETCLAAFDATSADQWPMVFNHWLASHQFDPYMAQSAQQMLYSWAVEQHMRALCHEYRLPSVSTPLTAYWAGEPVQRHTWLCDELRAINTLADSQVFDTDHLGIVQHDAVIAQLKQALVIKSL